MADPVLKVIPFRPGINQELTRYAGEGGWYDADKVRFRAGKPEKIGGWVNLNGTSDTQTFQGMARAMITWNLLNGTKMIGFGTNTALYAWDGGTYYDITPIRSSVNVSNCVNTSVGSSVITVSIAGHGASPGDTVIFTRTSVTVGGNVILNPSVSVSSSGDYTVNDPVPGTDSFNVTYVSVAAATSTGAGGDFTAQFLLNVGLQSAAAGFGWGVGTWGSSTWGTARSSSVAITLRTWSLDTFGEDLVANVRGGRIYQWDATNGTSSRAQLITASPSVVDSIIVSQESRHLFALGCTDTAGTYDPLNIRWCSAEDLTSWTPAATNTSGEKRLSGSNNIVGAIRSAGQILVWTDDALHSIKFTGPPFTFAINPVGANCGMIGPHAAVEAGGRTYWMGKNNFYMYDGNVNPLPCDVFHFVFDNINTTQGDKVFAGINSEWNEVLWLYQTTDSSTDEINRYVIYNYVEKTWTIGTLTRTAWADESTLEKPLGAGTDGKLYYHEVSVDADGSALSSFLQSNDFDLDSGDQLLFMDKIVPDFDMQGELSMTVKTRKYPGSSYTTKGPYSVSAATPKISMRARGRQALIQINTSTLGDDWRLGELRFQIAPDGRQ